MSKVIKIKDLPYKRYEIADVEQAYNTFENATQAARSAEDVVKARNVLIGTFTDYSTMGALAYYRYTLNTRDEFYLKEQEYYDQASPVVNTYMTKYADIMLNSPYRKELETILPSTAFLMYEYAKKAHSEEIVPEEQEENNLVTEYSQLMSQLTTDWQGEKRPLSFIRGYLEDKDRSVRALAAAAIDSMLSSVSDKLDDIFDRMVKVRDRMARKMGYKNYVELGYYRMNRIDYDSNMVSNFRKNVLSDIVPVVKQLKGRIAKGLGIDKTMFYDNDVIEGDEGNPRPYPDSQGILTAAQEMYRELNPEASALFDEMLEAEAFDVIARDGKWGGGYCMSLDTFKQPAILANFNGSAGDVDVVTHEFGHALAMFFVYGYGDLEVQIGSNETAETHSMSMEFFCWKYIDKFFKNSNRYRYKHLADALSFIPYGVIIDEFQHVVYENPDMTPSQRNDAYAELEKKYRPYLSYEGLPYLSKGTRWQFQMHVYETPFYYIDYCLAQTVALEFLSASRVDYSEAFDRYIAHCKRGGKYAFNKLVELAGLNSPFAEGALRDVAATAVKLIDELK